MIWVDLEKIAAFEESAMQGFELDQFGMGNEKVDVLIPGQDLARPPPAEQVPCPRNGRTFAATQIIIKTVSASVRQTIDSGGWTSLWK